MDKVRKRGKAYSTNKKLKTNPDSNINLIQDTTIKDNKNKNKPKKTINKKGLNIISINVRSLYQRKEELIDLLYLKNIEIVCIHETLLRKEQPININGYTGFHNNVRNKTRGGTAILIKNHIKFTPLKNLLMKVD